MNKQHKWHKEIKAWADGAEIEYHFETGAGSMSGWAIDHNPDWNDEECSFRIKPQPKKDKWLYVYFDIKTGNYFFGDIETVAHSKSLYIGKIKMDNEDD